MSSLGGGGLPRALVLLVFALPTIRPVTVKRRDRLSFGVARGLAGEAVDRRATRPAHVSPKVAAAQHGDAPKRRSLIRREGRPSARSPKSVGAELASMFSGALPERIDTLGGADIPHLISRPRPTRRARAFALAACAAALSLLYTVVTCMQRFVGRYTAKCDTELTRLRRLDGLVFEPKSRTAARCSSPKPSPGRAGAADAAGLCDLVAALPVLGATGTDSAYELEATLSECAKSEQFVRLQAVVDGATSGMPLWSPLTGQACVLHTTRAMQRARPGDPPVLLAAANECTDFFVSLQVGNADVPSIGRRHMRVKVCGAEVTLFGAFGGLKSVQAPDDVPLIWNNFISKNRVADSDEAVLPHGEQSEGRMVEFDERALLVGSKVTLVGRLVQCSSGAFHLTRPRPEGIARNVVEFDKAIVLPIMVTDDGSLLSDSSQTPARSAGVALARRSGDVA